MYLKPSKMVPPEIVVDIEGRNWVQVVSGDIFPGLESLPSGLIHAIYVSGSLNSNVPYSSSTVSSGTLIGKAEVYRLGIGDPVKYNQDCYALVRIPSSGLMFYADGPYKDPIEHWINDIPKKLDGAEVYIVKKEHE